MVMHSLPAFAFLKNSSILLQAVKLIPHVARQWDLDVQWFCSSCKHAIQRVLNSTIEGLMSALVYESKLDSMVGKTAEKDCPL